MLTSDKQREEYLKAYESHGKDFADRTVRGGDSIIKCGDALSILLNSTPLQTATTAQHITK